ncbi:unnamed protein product [Echinostoma caproni]|uniref:C2H2-type domain-containing protein n=1 Tax=Echinostoma caproni TaxID=27848 RepID=A0A183AXM7_9TREM|nr:unnamed protein product [Echinostoma caproni]
MVSHQTIRKRRAVQNQLVRLIFACPLKDCQTVCPDEVSFQAHFNRHLFGYLPGDLSGLFSSEPIVATGSETTNPVQPTDNAVKPTGTTVPSVGGASENNPSLEDPVEQSIGACTTSTPVRLSYPTGDRRDEVYPNLTSTDADTVPFRSASTEPHSSRVDPGVSYGNIQAIPSVPQVSAGTTAATIKEARALSDTSILVLRSSNNTLLVDVPASDDAPIDVGQDETTDVVVGPDRTPTTTPLIASTQAIAESRVDKLHPGGPVMVDSACPTSITFDGGHVDLTDHRNLLSALDLIPDDILMELLKEDRPGMWGDASGPSNFTTYSAPHEWDSLDWPVPDDPGEDPISEALSPNSRLLSRVDSSSTMPMPTVSCDNLDEFSAVSAADASPVPSSTNWVPSPVVHETWSLAVANERPCPELETDSSKYDRDLSASFDCPSLVLSDLTAALILPEVERRLRAKHESSQHNRSNNTAPTGVSPCLVPIPTCTVVPVGAAPESASVLPQTPEMEARHTRPLLSSGKRRRNASESSPTARYTEQCITSCATLPSKSGKHGSRQTDADQIVVGPETLTHNLVPKENKRSHGSMKQRLEGFRDPLDTPSSPPQSLPSPLSPQPRVRAVPASSVGEIRWVGRANSYQRLCPSPGMEPLDDAVFLCSTTPTLGSQRDLIDLGVHASPKHFGAQPKRRRRKLPKVYTVSSDFAPVAVVSGKTNLSRRHSLVYCNLVPSAQSPH